MRRTGHSMLSGILFLCLSALACISLSGEAQITAPNEWTWMSMGGSDSTHSPYGPNGVYGALGKPAKGNIPGGRDTASTWTDNNGNFWLFGGEGVDADGHYGQLNDLWEFDPATTEWTWMGGSSALPASCAGSTTVPCGHAGVYGARGIAVAGNIPGGRSGASSWTDKYGNFWLFAGYGFDADRNAGELNDLWEFNPATKEWKWIGGSSAIGRNGGQSGVYGNPGSGSPANVPGGRDAATSWIDKNGQLWIYGGEGFDGEGDYAHLDDLWKFDPATREWTWMGGSSSNLPAVCAASGVNPQVCGWPAIYGALGVPASGISPGSRIAATGWTDNDGNLWLFGGLGNVFWEERDFSSIDQYDLWEFNPSTRLWAWMGGNSISICGESSSEDWCGQNGIYGDQGEPAIADIPPSRNNTATWTDSAGNFWLFGGAQPYTTNVYGAALCNDVWVFETDANEWAWMDGAAQFGSYSCSRTPGIYGVLGEPAALSTPSGRAGSASWTDRSGNLWIFGGFGWANGINIVDLDDLWVYQPVAPAPVPSFAVIASPNPINIGAIGAGASTITKGIATVSIRTAGGFDSPVTLTASRDTMNGVTDITGSFQPARITGAGSSRLTISVTGKAVMVTEPIPLTVTATSGDISQSIQVIVDVTQIGEIPPPVFSVPSGKYSTSRTVTITDSALNGYDDEFIYYTTDGSTPTPSSPVYVSPITVSSTTTLKAIAILTDDFQSAVSAATYTFPPARTITRLSASRNDTPFGSSVTFFATVTPPTVSGPLKFTIDGTQAGQPVALLGGNATLTISTLRAGSHTVVASYAATSSGTASSASMTETVTRARPVIGWATPEPIARGTPLGAAQLDAKSDVAGQFTYEPPAGAILPPGVQTLTATFVPADSMDFHSVKSSVEIRVLRHTTTPTFDPPQGPYKRAQSVTISDDTSGAVIYYTTDGTTPTAGSTVFTRSIKVTGATTINAIAVARGYADSEMATASYTIQ